MQYSVQINNVSKAYGAVKAINNITLRIEKGDMYAIMGADGSGRTTLFRLMTSLICPDSGSIMVEGCNTVSDYKQLRTMIGYMPGKFSLYGDLTVEENLNFFASVYGVELNQNKYLVDDIYRQIEPFKDRAAAKLSGGMKQKLALCCALIHAPKVLFLDEPTTGVDPVSRKELWAMLKKLNAQGITIIVSTPYLDEIRLCRHAALLESGELKAQGSPADIVAIFDGSLGKNHSVDTSTPIIKINNLVKRFGNFTAVDHISFQVNKGEIFGFLGANGAGKTTAMKIICGLSMPTEGGGTVMGYDIATQPEMIKKRIGYMSQKFSLYDNLTVEENLRLFGGIYGMSKSDIERRTNELLEELKFVNERKRMVSTLPLGWKQRLAFAVSIIHSPEIVFLDEPTGGVDPVARRNFWEMIYAAANAGTTIFVTTHYMDEAGYCDRISIMVDGRIEALDSPDNLKIMYNADDMDEVFGKLARKARRSE